MEKIREQHAAKVAIAELLSVHIGIDLVSAIDIVNNCQLVVNDFLSGVATEYNTIGEVLKDYLGLTAEYEWVFNPVYIPTGYTAVDEPEE